MRAFAIGAVSVWGSALMVGGVLLAGSGCGSTQCATKDPGALGAGGADGELETIVFDAGKAPGEVVLAGVTRFDGTDSTAHEEIYVRVIATRGDGTVERSRSPETHWSVPNEGSRVASADIDETVWSGEIPSDSSVEVRVELWESDPIYNPDDQIGEARVLLTNVHGEIVTTFAQDDANTTALGTHAGGVYRYLMQGNNAKYYLEFVDPR